MNIKNVNDVLFFVWLGLAVLCMVAAHFNKWDNIVLDTALIILGVNCYMAAILLDIRMHVTETG